MPRSRRVTSVAPLFRRKRVYVALAGAFLCVVWGSVGMWRGIASRSAMAPVDAQIRTAEAVSFGPPGSRRYRTQVELTYIVNEQMRSVPLSVPEVASTREELREQLIRYSPGTTIRVLHRPDRQDDVEWEIAGSIGFLTTPLLLLGLGLALLTTVFVAATRQGGRQCGACGTAVAKSHAYCHACSAEMPRRKGRMAR